MEIKPIINTGNNLNKVDIVIIGTGLSGLTSALKIQRKQPNLRLRMLENSNIVGGQLSAVSVGEIGAKWITEDQCHIHCLLNNLNVPMRKRSIMGADLKSYGEMDDGIFSWLAKFELMRYINELELKIDFFRPGLRESRNPSMYYHICNRLFFKNSRQYMMNLVLLVCGVCARDISYNDFMGICFTCGGVKRLIDILIEVPNYSMLEFSSKDLLGKILDHLNATEIIFSRKACEIFQYRDHVEVIDSENVCHIADAVILAVPLSSLKEFKFWPSLPIELENPSLSAEKTNFFITSFLASYNQAHWRTKGYSGHFVKHQPLLVAHEYRPTVYCGFIVHHECIEPLIRSTILHELAKAYGRDMFKPKEFHQHSYELNTLDHLPLTTPWNRVIWSSSAAAGTCYRGYLGGAVQSGIRAAVNALLVVRPQAVTWQDIAEVQCHDHLQERRATWTLLWLSTWNLYNVSSWTLFVCGLVLVLRKTYKRH